MSYHRLNLVNLIPLMDKGRTNKQIARHYKVSPVTVARWIGMLKKNGKVIPYRRRGRPNKITIDETNITDIYVIYVLK